MERLRCFLTTLLISWAIRITSCEATKDILESAEKREYWFYEWVTKDKK